MKIGKAEKLKHASWMTHYSSEKSSRLITTGFLPLAMSRYKEWLEIESLVEDIAVSGIGLLLTKKTEIRDGGEL